MSNMRVAVVYDCLYPHTIGGAERFYRDVAARLARRHDVTYVTRRQWAVNEMPAAPPGVTVVTVSAGHALYTASGRRKIVPPLRFGWGLFWHLLRHRARYDVVQTCGFPYFSLLAARAACACGGPVVVTDWLEVWTSDYWREYLGPLAGRLGAAVQRLCIRVTGPAFVLSALHARRLLDEGYAGKPLLLSGIFDDGATVTSRSETREPLVVFAGRHIPEKGVAAIPAAIALARARIPNLRAAIFGDGPERPRVLAEIERLGLRDVITCPGFVPWPEVDDALRHALCAVLPSCREGYGLLVVEAAARGTPTIVVRHPDNAATELIGAGENGVIAEHATPEDLAAAIAAVHAGGSALLERTRQWFERHAPALSIDAAIAEYERVYADEVAHTSRLREPDQPEAGTVSCP